jgi:CRP/FNR family transcriptional regulator
MRPMVDSKNGVGAGGAPADRGRQNSSSSGEAAPCPFGVKLGCTSVSGQYSPRACRGRLMRLSRGGALALSNYRGGAAVGVVSGALTHSILLADGRKQIVNLQLSGETVLHGGSDDDSQLHVYAARHATLCVFDVAEALRDRRFGEDFAQFLNNEAWRAVHEMQDHLLTLGRRSPSERLASFLIDLDARLNRSNAPGTVLSIPITRADIGDYLGLGSETVSRLFTQFKSKSLIRLLSPNRVVIIDKSSLGEIAKGEVS